MGPSFSTRKFLESFRYACNGLKTAARSERNFRIHLAAALLAVTGGILLKASAIEFIAIILCIASVMATELINTAIERLCNFISPEKRAAIKVIKDLSAAAVLMAAIGAFIVALIIFIPKCKELFLRY